MAEAARILQPLRDATPQGTSSAALPAAVTIKEIAAALGISRQGAQTRAEKEGWRFTEETTRGGRRRLYPVAFLPDQIVSALERCIPIQSVSRAFPESARGAGAATALAPAQAAVISLPPPAPRDTRSLKTFQREPMVARSVVLHEIEHYEVAFELKRSAAISMLLGRARHSDLAADILQALAIANARRGKRRLVSRSTIYNWFKARDAADHVSALAPKGAPELPPPAWVPSFLERWGDPAKPTIAACLRNWPDGDRAPSIGQARRFLARMPAIFRERRRIGPRLMKGMRAYVRRDFSQFWPGAVFIGDGHTFKAQIAHPRTGRPFRAEITIFLDVFTRMWVGYSIALAENTWSVADALRDAMVNFTTPDVVYYDNGSGAKNKTWDDQVNGLAARLAITMFHSAPWSSQARGVIERFNRSVLHPLAQRFATYVGQHMDKEARALVDKRIAADIKERGASRILPTAEDLREALDAEREAYNSREHSALSKIADHAAGRRRHLSPREAWDHAIAEGWQPEPIERLEAADLFKPAETRVVNRATIRLYDNVYFAPELEAFHGQPVQVVFDIHDPGAIDAYSEDGRFICAAQAEGNRRDYLPKAFVERAHEKRVEGKLKRVEARRQKALAEATPNIAIAAERISPASALPAEQEAPEDAAYEARMVEWEAALDAAEAASEPEADPAMERFRRALRLEETIAAGGAIPETDAAWLARYRATPEYRARRLVYDDFGEEALIA